MTASTAIIALGPYANPTINAIAAAFVGQWPDEPKPKAVTGNAFAFRVGSQMIDIVTISTPISWTEYSLSTDDERPQTNGLWPEAASDLRNHTAHLIVTVNGDEALLVQKKLLTQIVTATLMVCHEAIGVLWTEAGLVIKPSIFVEHATGLMQAGPPMFLWVNFILGKDAEKTFGMTMGMQSLGFMEIEAPNSPESPEKLRERMLWLAHYLIENGPVIKDGETFGFDADDRIRIVFADSAFGRSGKTMQLEFATETEKKKKRTRMHITAYGYIQALTTLALTITFGWVVHSWLRGILSWTIVRHLILDIPILIFGFILLIVSDKFLQRTFGLEAYEEIESQESLPSN